jgi:competence protein ComEA
MKNALYVLLGVMAGFVLAGVLVFVSRAPQGEPILLQPAPTKAPLAVHVIGAVPRPGLYEFAEGARVQDAIDAAGGLLTDANVDALNLAALLKDGQQLVIPYKDGREVSSGADSVQLPSSESNGSSSSDGSSPGSSPPDSSSGTGPSDGVSNNTELVNINTATLDELNALPGIGPTTAQKIIDYRTANGPFSTIEDIINVSGIGTATFEEIKDLITV